MQEKKHITLRQLNCCLHVPDLYIRTASQVCAWQLSVHVTQQILTGVRRLLHGRPIDMRQLS